MNQGMYRHDPAFYGRPNSSQIRPQANYERPSTTRPAHSRCIPSTYYQHYRVITKAVSSEWQGLSEMLRSFGINTSYIQCVRRCINPNHHKSRAKKNPDPKATTETTLWYQTSPELAVAIARDGFLFKYMTDFSKLMDTSGFNFDTNPRVSNKTIVESSSTETHLFQCRLQLTDKQLGYLRH